MSEMVHECEHDVAGPDGRRYRARVFAEERGDVWAGWLTFSALGEDRTVSTDVETTQPSRDAVRYWATGLEPVYLDGALARAK